MRPADVYQTSEAYVNKYLHELRNKNEQVRSKAANNLRIHVEAEAREMSAGTFNKFMLDLHRRLFDLISSPEIHEKFGGLTAMDELIDVPMDDNDTKINRFAIYLRSVFSPSSQNQYDPSILPKAAQTLGHLARSGGSSSSSIIEYELARAIEWIEGKNTVMVREKFEYQRLAGCYIIRELALSVINLSNAFVFAILNVIWKPILKDSRLVVREAGVSALRSTLELLANKVRTSPNHHIYSIQINKLWKLILAGLGEKESIASVHGALLALPYLIDYSYSTNIITSSQVHKTLKYVFDYSSPNLLYSSASSSVSSLYKSKLILKAAISCFPSLVVASPDYFIGTDALQETANRLCSLLSCQPDRDTRALIFDAIGDIALTVREAFLPYIEAVVQKIQAALVLNTNSPTASNNTTNLFNPPYSKSSNFPSGSGNLHSSGGGGATNLGGGYSGVGSSNLGKDNIMALLHDEYVDHNEINYYNEISSEFNYLKNPLPHQQRHQATKKNTISTEGNNSDALRCLAALAQAIGNRLKQYVLPLIEQLFESGISLVLIETLSHLCMNIQELLPIVQSRLLVAIANVIRLASPHYESCESSIGGGGSTIVRNVRVDANALSLALSAFGLFSILGIEINISLLCECTLRFLEHPSANVRREAALATSRLLQPKEVRISERGGSGGNFMQNGPSKTSKGMSSKIVKIPNYQILFQMNYSGAAKTSIAHALKSLLYGADSPGPVDESEQYSPNAYMAQDSSLFADSTRAAAMGVTFSCEPLRHVSVYQPSQISQFCSQLYRLLTYVLSEPDEGIRKAVLESFDSRIDGHLCSESCLVILTQCLNDEALSVRRAAAKLLGRLSHLNPSRVLPSLRTILGHLLVEMKSLGRDNVKEEAIDLLGLLLVECRSILSPYVYLVILHSVDLLEKLLGIAAYANSNGAGGNVTSNRHRRDNVSPSRYLNESLSYSSPNRAPFNRGMIEGSMSNTALTHSTHLSKVAIAPRIPLSNNNHPTILLNSNNSASSASLITQLLRTIGLLSEVGGPSLLPIVRTRVMRIISVVITGSHNTNPLPASPYVQYQQRETALRTMRLVIENTGYIIGPYVEYSPLMISLISSLRSDYHTAEQRRLLVRVVGTVGAINPTTFALIESRVKRGEGANTLGRKQALTIGSDMEDELKKSDKSMIASNILDQNPLNPSVQSTIPTPGPSAIVAVESSAAKLKHTAFMQETSSDHSCELFLDELRALQYDAIEDAIQTGTLEENWNRVNMPDIVNKYQNESDGIMFTSVNNENCIKDECVSKVIELLGETLVSTTITTSTQHVVIIALMNVYKSLGKGKVPPSALSLLPLFINSMLAAETLETKADILYQLSTLVRYASTHILPYVSMLLDAGLSALNFITFPITTLPNTGEYDYPSMGPSHEGGNMRRPNIAQKGTMEGAGSGPGVDGTSGAMGISSANTSTAAVGTLNNGLSMSLHGSNSLHTGGANGINNSLSTSNGNSKPKFFNPATRTFQTVAEGGKRHVAIKSDPSSIGVNAGASGIPNSSDMMRESNNTYMLNDPHYGIMGTRSRKKGAHMSDSERIALGVIRLIASISSVSLEPLRTYLYPVMTGFLELLANDRTTSRRISFAIVRIIRKVSPLIQDIVPLLIPTLLRLIEGAQGVPMALRTQCCLCLESVLRVCDLSHYISRIALPLLRTLAQLHADLHALRSSEAVGDASSEVHSKVRVGMTGASGNTGVNGNSNINNKNAQGMLSKALPNARNDKNSASGINNTEYTISDLISSLLLCLDAASERFSMSFAPFVSQVRTIILKLNLMLRSSKHVSPNFLKILSESKFNPTLVANSFGGVPGRSHANSATGIGMLGSSLTGPNNSVAAMNVGSHSLSTPGHIITSSPSNTQQNATIIQNSAGPVSTTAITTNAVSASNNGVSGTPVTSISTFLYDDELKSDESEDEAPRGSDLVYDSNNENIKALVSNFFENTNDQITKEEWLTWLRNTSLQLLKNSPSIALQACYPVASLYSSLAKYIFPIAFICMWTSVNDIHQEIFLKALEIALRSPTLPPEVLHVVLNLSEYAEKYSALSQIPLDYKLLGELSEKAHAYAKAIFYKEMEYYSMPETSVEALIWLNNQVQLTESALGVLSLAQNVLNVRLKVSWLEKLERWEDALAAYEVGQLESLIATATESYTANEQQMQQYDRGTVSTKLRPHERIDDDLYSVTKNATEIHVKSETASRMGSKADDYSLKPDTGTVINNIAPTARSILSDKNDNNLMRPQGIDSGSSQREHRLKSSNLEHSQMEESVFQKSVIGKGDIIEENDARSCVSTPRSIQNNVHPYASHGDSPHDVDDPDHYRHGKDTYGNYLKGDETNEPDTTYQNLELFCSRLRCLHALGEWSRLAKLTRTCWTTSFRLLNASKKQDVAYYGAAAAFNMKDWMALQSYVNVLQIGHSHESSFFIAVLAIHDKDAKTAHRAVRIARERLNPELRTLASESFVRAYPALAKAQELAELEECVAYQQAYSEERRETLRANWARRLRIMAPRVSIWHRILHLRSLVLRPEECIGSWTSFASLCRRQGKLALAKETIHNLMETPAANDPRVVLAHIKNLYVGGECTRATEDLRIFINSFTNAYPESIAILPSKNANISLKNFSVLDPPVISPLLSFAKSAQGISLPTVESQEAKKNIFSPAVSFHSMDSSSLYRLMAKVHLKLSKWMRADWERRLPANHNESIFFSNNKALSEILSPIATACVYDNNYYAAWNEWGLFHFNISQHAESVRCLYDNHIASGMNSNNGYSRTYLNFVDESASGNVSNNAYTNKKSNFNNFLMQFVLEALKGFNRSILLTALRPNPHDVLRLLTLWFAHSNDPAVANAIRESVSVLPVATWVEVVPQILARLRVQSFDDPKHPSATHEQNAMNMSATISSPSAYTGTNTTSALDEPLGGKPGGRGQNLHQKFLNVSNEAPMPSLRNKDVNSNIHSTVHLASNLYLPNESSSISGASAPLPQSTNTATTGSTGHQKSASGSSNTSILQSSLFELLRKVGQQYPEQLVFPFTVACSSREAGLALGARRLLEEMRSQRSELVEQSLLVSRELVRVSSLWHEQWYLGIETASRQYYSKSDLPGMFDTLLSLHDKISSTNPETFRELSFIQAFGRDLDEAKQWLVSAKSTYDTETQLHNTTAQSKNGNNDFQNNSAAVMMSVLTKVNWGLEQAWIIYYRVFQRLSRQLQSTSRLDLQYVSPALHVCRNLSLPIPRTSRLGSSMVFIESFAPTLCVMTSKQRPRVIQLLGSNGLKYKFLLKGHEDLKQDERVMQLFNLINALLASNSETSLRDMRILTFAIVPLSPSSGLIEWVRSCDTLNALIRAYREANDIPVLLEHQIIRGHLGKSSEVTLLQSVEALRKSLHNTKGDDIRKVLWYQSPSSETWLVRRTTYARSLALTSLVGYILGLGDRHPSNIMLRRYSGRLFHIDFGDCFEVASYRDRFPEQVPFRLTRMLLQALEVSCLDGCWRLSANLVCVLLRETRDTVVAMLEAFLHDPLITWHIVPLNRLEMHIRKQQINYNPKEDIVPQVISTKKSILGGNVKVGPRIVKITRNSGQTGTLSVMNNAIGVENTTVESPVEEKKGKVGGVLLESVMRSAGRIASMTDAEKFLSYKNDPLLAPTGATGSVAGTSSAIPGLAMEESDVNSEKYALAGFAKAVLVRVQNKLKGKEYGTHMSTQEQIQKLVLEATSLENLAVSYPGWCAFW